MTARMKIDEDLPSEIGQLFMQHGYDALSVSAQGWSGISDPALWPRIQDEGRVLVTADKGFADLRRYPPGSHAGVILLRAREESRRAYLSLAAIALDRVALEELSGAIVVVTDRGVRVRHSPK